MANFRQIHVSMWKDGWFSDLGPDEKLLFIYFFSNEGTSLSGLYKVTKKVIAFETGISRDRVDEILSKFARDGKVYYEGEIVWVVNMRKFHETKSNLVQKRIEKDVKMIPESQIKNQFIAYQNGNIPYRYPIDTLQQLKEDEDEDEDEDKDDDDKDDDDLFQSNLLSAAFEQASGIPAHSPQKWCRSLDEMEKLSITPDDVREATHELLDKGYSVVGIWSIQNAAISCMSKRKNGSRPKSKRPGKALEILP